MWAKSGRLPSFRTAVLPTIESSSALVATGNLLDEIDNPPPQFRIFNPHECFGESQAVGGRQEVGDVSPRGCLGQPFVTPHHLRTTRTFEEKRYTDLKNMRNLLQAAGTDAIGALLVLLNLLK